MRLVEESPLELRQWMLIFWIIKILEMWPLTFATTLSKNTQYFNKIVPYNTVGNTIGCAQTNFRTEILSDPEFNFPNVFTPNGGGYNVDADFHFSITKEILFWKLPTVTEKLFLKELQTNGLILPVMPNNLKVVSYWKTDKPTILIFFCQNFIFIFINLPKWISTFKSQIRISNGIMLETKPVE